MHPLGPGSGSRARPSRVCGRRCLARRGRRAGPRSRREPRRDGEPAGGRGRSPLRRAGSAWCRTANFPTAKAAGGSRGRSPGAVPRAAVRWWPDRPAPSPGPSKMGRNHLIPALPWARHWPTGPARGHRNRGSRGPRCRCRRSGPRTAAGRPHLGHPGTSAERASPRYRRMWCILQRGLATRLLATSGQAAEIRHVQQTVLIPVELRLVSRSHDELLSFAQGRVRRAWGTRRPRARPLSSALPDGTRLEEAYAPAAVAARLQGGPAASHLRDLVYDAIDGTVTTFAVVAGAAGAGLDGGCGGARSGQPGRPRHAARSVPLSPVPRLGHLMSGAVRVQAGGVGTMTTGASAWCSSCSGTRP